MYYVNSYYLKEDKAIEYQKWLLSDEAKQLFADVEAETGWHYVETYWPIMGFGEYDVEDWWELPDWAAFDKSRASKATERLMSRWNELDFGDPSRPASTRMLRSTSDVKIFE